MEPRELSPALLQPQVTVVAILGELLATLRGLDMMLPAVRLSLRCLSWDLEEFTEELRDSLCCVSDTWRRHTVPSDDDESPTSYDNDSVTSLSRALAASKSAPWIPQNRVTMAARKWQGLVAVLVNRWAQLAMAATKLPNAWRDLATKADDRVATATARARELQDKAASDGTAQENMEELGQLLGREEGDEEVSEDESSSEDASSPSLGEEVVEVAKASTGAMIVRQRVETALGLLERLVAACDEATAFPRELQRLLRDIEVALKGTTEASPKVPEDLVAKVAVAEQLWEANTRLVKDHLGETLKDIIRFYFTGAPASRSACGVAERCQRAIEDIPRLVQPPECPQSVPKVSPVSMEPQELSPAPLQTQVTVVAILGELLATLPGRDEMLQLMSPRCLYWDLLDFTKELRATLHRSDDTWRHHDVTSNGDDTLASLSWALATYKSIPGTTRNRVTMAASEWQGSVAALVNSWARLARKATKLRYTWREVATKVNTKAATATARARELQDKAAHDGTAQKQRVELGLPLFWVERPKVVTGPEARVKRAARVAASEATRATMVRQRVEAALGLPERLVATCHKATAFPRELQRRVGDIEAALKGTNEASCDVPEALVAKMAVAERLWEANTRLAKDHLVGTVDHIYNSYFTGGPDSPSACGVAERCQRATEDIPRLLRTPECPQSIAQVSPVSMELQEVRQGVVGGDRDCTGGTRGLAGGASGDKRLIKGQRGKGDPLEAWGPLQEATSASKSLTPPLSPPQVSPPQLQVLVAVVATLGEVVATMTGPDRGKLLHKSPNSLHEGLRRFTRNLCVILDHGSVTSLGHRGVPSLGQALAAHRATPGTTWANVRAAASAWHELVARLVDSWDWLAREATRLCEKVVMDQQLMVALDKEEVAWEMATHDAQVSAATNEAMGEAVVATRRGHWAVVALGPLQRLVATCNRATLFNWNMECRLRDIEAILKGTNEVSPDVLQALVAKVAKFEWLWRASARLAKDHLQGTLGDIHNLLLGPCGDRSGPGGPGSHAVAK
ncbi:uncharacterized protein LOC132340512 [Haemorhous mexicanus]|uniref:uncharacterized protein LOC132340512 n=1 Tax=Haemorhous mexicanus TaxID=30427 RepID=UPI0028BEBD33|nr:uncharacterized protein LOC132340512 [Haemorhous mexicanus]